MADLPGALKAVESCRMLDGVPVLVSGARVIHAYPGWADLQSTRLEILATAGVAWCGIRIKAILSEPFEVDAKDACPTCAQYVRSGVREPTQPRPLSSRPRETLFAGYERYDETVTLEHGGFTTRKHRVRTVPAGHGLAHAVSLRSDYPTITRFLDAEWPKRTWCGIHCLVVTPYGFFEDEPDACPACAKAVEDGNQLPMKIAPVDHSNLDNTL